jgi:hypothetical protein
VQVFAIERIGKMTMANNASLPAAEPARKLDLVEVGWQFVEQYYTIMNKEPNRLHCFYNAQSTMLHGTENEHAEQCNGQHVLLYCYVLACR